ncbi:MAG: polysulfide reductase NrfD [Coriobacteriaceae bacterium]|jgi:molybdopterin-containing oxidoreductase family membrane subunit|nr:polysulfide reductase NrfD [Coriobacteriaceae bacterium]
MTETTMGATGSPEALPALVPDAQKDLADKPKDAQQVFGRGFSLALVIAAVIAAAGLVLWGVQLTQGLVLSNMRNLTSWGFYITNFMFLVGLSAGGLIISSAPKVFGIKGFGGIAKIAIWTSVCATVLAIAFVVVDLGQPLRLWELFAYSNLSSPLMWDIIVLTVYLIVSVVYLWATLRTEAGKGSPLALRALSVIALIAAILVHSVTAWIFGLQIGHDLWYTALLAPWFVSSALVCGLALVLVVVMGLKKAGYLVLAQENIIKMVKLLGIFVMVDLYFFGCDLLTAGFPGAEGAAVVAMLTTGALAPFFWIELVSCAAVAIIAFVPSLRTNTLVVIASALAILAIFCKRVQLLVGGFQLPNIDLAGPATGPGLTDMGAATQAMGGAMVYFPSPLEFGLTLGVFGLGALMLLAGLRFLPLKPVDKD